MTAQSSERNAAAPHKSGNMSESNDSREPTTKSLSSSAPHRDLYDSDDPQDLYDSDDSERLKKSQSASRIDRGVILALPKETYISRALKHTAHESEMKGGISGEPWQSAMFAFARLCKAHPSLTGLSDLAAIREVDKVLRALLNKPRVNAWEHFFPFAGNADEIHRDFMSSWLSIKFIPFTEVLGSAAEMAKARPLSPEQCRGKLYASFISLAGALQRIMGEKPILLPTRRVASILGCNQRTVSDLRKFAIADGLLTIIQRHKFASTGTSCATKFRFAIEKFDQSEEGSR